MNEMPDQPRPTTFTITGRNQYGEVVTETITSDMLNDPFVQELGYITREKYASIGIDLDAELNRMVKRKKTLMWCLYWSDRRICRALYRVIQRVLSVLRWFGIVRMK